MEEKLRQLVTAFAAFQEKMEGTVNSVKEAMKTGQESVKEEMKTGQVSVKDEMKAVQESVKEEMKAVQESVKDEMKAVKEEITCIIEIKFEGLNDARIETSGLLKSTSIHLLAELPKDPEFGNIYAYLKDPDNFEHADLAAIRKRARNYEIIDNLLFYIKSTNEYHEDGNNPEFKGKHPGIPMCKEPVCRIVKAKDKIYRQDIRRCHSSEGKKEKNNSHQGTGSRDGESRG
ncbi:hypothetical protein X975_25677, partial [Stegodyphus mimosarum]